MVQYVFVHKCKILKKYTFYNFTFSYDVEIKKMLLETMNCYVVIWVCMCDDSKQLLLLIERINDSLT